MSAHEGGVVGLPDPEVLRIAAVENRVVLSHHRRTMPRHFHRFIAESDSPGLIIIPQSLDLAAVIDDPVMIWAASHDAEWHNRIGYLPI